MLNRHEVFCKYLLVCSYTFLIQEQLLVGEGEQLFDDTDERLREQYEFHGLVSRLRWAVGASFGVRYGKGTKASSVVLDHASAIYEAMIREGP